MTLDVDAAPPCNRPQCHELVLERQREGEEARVLGIERPAHRIEPFALETLEIHVDREPQALAVVPHVDLVGEIHLSGRHTVARQRRAASSASDAQLLRDLPGAVSENLRMNVREASSRTAVVASPSAQSTPGPGGMIAGQEPSRRASAFACSGPAPPKAISA